MTRPHTSAPAFAGVAIVGTAGHIDHGKTALVRRLTGVDTDRLPEEKARGISIDLGFAPLTTPAGVRVGLVDVPGHERFVKNMLAGVGGVDLVLLVIAADEGVMPQTREHLAIIQLLGVPRAIVVLTKADLVEREWMEMVKRDVVALLATTPLAGASIVEFSALDGRGQPELLALLDQQLATLPGREDDAPARLPIDRVFVAEGFGTVVTGTLWRGAVRTGDTLELLPGARALRVRRVQVHGVTVDAARAGQRTAIALHGIERREVARGDWLVAPGSLRPSSVLDVRFELLPDYPKRWPAQARVRFHLGAGEHLGRLLLLEGTGLAAGTSALAQLRLERPTVGSRGDRFVIRSYSPARTIGGGTVIEPVAQRRRRHAGLEALAVRERGSLEARALERLEAEAAPVATATLARALSESETSVAAALESLRAEGAAISPADGRWLSSARWEAARDAVMGEVTDYAGRHPARFGIPKGDLKSALKPKLDAALFDAGFESLFADSRLVVKSERVRPANDPWSPPAATLAALERLEASFDAAGYAVPENREWQLPLAAQASEIMALGLFLERLVRVSQDLTYSTKQMEALRGRIRQHFAKKPTLDVADFKTLTGASRKYAVPLLEFMDRSGWTVRAGDVRKPGGRLGS
jgi:selenocysteine-specific elongation factor